MEIPDRQPLLRARAALAIGVLSAFFPVLGHSQTTAVGRPILFLHGWCSEAGDWRAFATGVANHVGNARSDLYANQHTYDLYYDGDTVRNWSSGTAFPSTENPADARIFAISFYDPSSTNSLTGFTLINTQDVAAVSILNKADELAHVIGAITAFTKSKDLIVIAHSQGGLVARAYLEQLAVSSHALCPDTDFRLLGAIGG